MDGKGANLGVRLIIERKMRVLDIFRIPLNLWHELCVMEERFGIVSEPCPDG